MDPMPIGDDNVVGGAIVAVTLGPGLRSSRTVVSGRPNAARKELAAGLTRTVHPNPFLSTAPGACVLTATS